MVVVLIFSSYIRTRWDINDNKKKRTIGVFLHLFCCCCYFFFFFFFFVVFLLFFYWKYEIYPNFVSNPKHRYKKFPVFGRYSLFFFKQHSIFIVMIPKLCCCCFVLVFCSFFYINVYHWSLEYIPLKLAVNSIGKLSNI